MEIFKWLSLWLPEGVVPSICYAKCLCLIFRNFVLLLLWLMEFENLKLQSYIIQILLVFMNFQLGFKYSPIIGVMLLLIFWFMLNCCGLIFLTSMSAESRLELCQNREKILIVCSTLNPIQPSICSRSPCLLCQCQLLSFSKQQDWDGLILRAMISVRS